MTVGAAPLSAGGGAGGGAAADERGIGRTDAFHRTADTKNTTSKDAKTKMRRSTTMRAICERTVSRR